MKKRKQKTKQTNPETISAFQYVPRVFPIVQMGVEGVRCGGGEEENEKKREDMR